MDAALQEVIDPVSFATDIVKLKAKMAMLPQIDFADYTRHHFVDGLYLRELARPAGALILGKRHKREHFYVVVTGELEVVGEGFYAVVKAPGIFTSLPGVQRLVYARTAALCFTLHPNPLNIRDIPTLEAWLIEEEPDSPFGPGNVLKEGAAP